ncbi:MAG: hypothetical protein V4692_00325 [Bdellovibrionota bacterium]
MISSQQKIHHKRLIRDVSRVKTTTVFVIGVIAGLIVSPLKPGIAEGSIGFLSLHLLVSGIAACGYAILLRSARRSGFGVGLQLSLFHWIISGTIVGLIPDRPDLSFFMAQNGLYSFTAYAAMHFVFGGMVGILFDRSAIRMEYARPMNERYI